MQVALYAEVLRMVLELWEKTFMAFKLAIKNYQLQMEIFLEKCEDLGLLIDTLRESLVNNQQDIAEAQIRNARHFFDKEVLGKEPLLSKAHLNEINFVIAFFKECIIDY